MQGQEHSLSGLPAGEGPGLGVSQVALGLCRPGAAEVQVLLRQPKVGTALLLHSAPAGHKVWLTS